MSTPERPNRPRPQPFTLDPTEHGLPTLRVLGADQPDGGYCRQVRDLTTANLLEGFLHTGACALPDAGENTPTDFAAGCVEAARTGPTFLVSGYHAGWTMHPDGRFVSPTGFTIITRGAGFDCCDCGTNTIEINEHYFLHHDLWAAAMAAAAPAKPNPHGTEMLCVGCVETRLGRPLTPADFFPDLPINGPDETRSDRLKDRMGLA